MKKVVLLLGVGLGLGWALLLVLSASRLRASVELPASAPSPAELASPTLETLAVPERASVAESRAGEPAFAPTTEEPSTAPVSFHGVLVDAEDGRPIEGYVYQRLTSDVVSLAELQSAEGHGAVRSGADGSFVLPLPGKLGIGWALAEGYGTVPIVFDEEHRSPEEAQRIELLPAAQLELTVLDAAFAPLAGVAVALDWPRIEAQRADTAILSGKKGSSSRPSHTGADGRATFENLPAERVLDWSATREEDGLGRNGRLALAPRERRALTVVLGGGARLRGTVLDEDGAFVPELELWLARPDRRRRFLEGRELVASTRSDALGRFELVDLPFEPLVLGPAPGQGAILPHGELLVIEDRDVESDVVVRRGLAIEGWVDGLQTEGLTVWAVGDAGGDAVEAATDAEGRFRIAPLAPGEYLVHIEDHQFFSDAVRASAGATEVVLRTLQARRIPVHVEHASGEYGFEVRKLERRTGVHASRRQADFEWNFHPGPCSILATTLDGRIGWLPRVEIGPFEPARIHLSLEPSASVTVVHRAESGVRELRLFVGGTPLPLPIHSAWRRTGSLAGSAETFAVPAGLLRAELVENGAVAASTEIFLQAGERRRLMLEVP